MPEFLSIHIEQERLQKALDAADIGIWDFNPITNEIIWSRKCYELFGLNQDQIITQDIFFSGLHPDDRKRTAQKLSDALNPEHGGQIDMEYRVINDKSRLIYWLRVTGKAYFNESGKPTRLIGIVVDITQEKNILVREQENERLLKDITDSAPVALWITDANGNWTFKNKTWSDWTGLSHEEILEEGWMDALTSEDKAEIKGKIQEAVSKQSSLNADFRIFHKTTKGVRWCLAYGYPRYSEKGKFAGLAGSCVDITERKDWEEAIRYKTALFEAQNEATSDGIVIVDAKGKMLSYNRRFIEIWQFPEEIVTRRDDNEALAFAMKQLEDPEGFLKRVKELYHEIPTLSEDELRFKDGRIVIRHGRPVTGSDGTNYGWVWKFKDVTQARKKEESLKFKTALLEAVQEASPDGILITDGRGKIIMSNSRFAELWGIPNDIILNKDDEASLLFGMNQTINPEKAINKVREVYQNPDTIIEDELYFTNGKILERRARPIKGKDGAYYGWAWYFKDITEHRRAEQELEKRNAEQQQLMQEFKFVTDFMPQLVWSTEPNGYHDFYNRRWYEYTGLNFEETKGEGWNAVLHPDDRERARDVWNHSLQTGAPYEIEYRFRRYDGIYRWFLGRALPLRDENGKILKWFGTCTDIQDQKMQTDLLEQRVTERTVELQAVNTSLERSNRELEQFAYIASHDLQEPLRKIRTFIDMMNMDLEKGQIEKVQQQIVKINQSSARMNDLIKDLLNFSRLNLSHSDTFEQTDLNTIFQYIIEDLELAIMQKGAFITSDQLPVIHAIPLQMSQLFYNLINNSLKFSKKDVQPRIEVTCRLLSQEEKERWFHINSQKVYHDITFKDNGIGFSSEYAEQIFTIFQRLHSRSAYEGTGIGLALCKKIALNHQGDIYAVSEEGVGAEFHVILPE